MKKKLYRSVYLIIGGSLVYIIYLLILAFFLIRLVYSLFYLDKDFISDFFFNFKKSSFIYRKSKSGGAYGIIYFLLDIPYLIKRGFSFKEFILFVFFFIYFSFLSVFFFISYFISLFSLLIVIFFCVVFKIDTSIKLFSYFNEFSPIFNILLTPFNLAKISIYGVLSYGRGKFDFNLLDQFLFSRILGSSFWVIKRSVLWACDFESLLEMEVYRRKSIWLWPALLRERFLDIFKSTVGFRLIIESVIYSNCRILIKDGKPFVNPNKLEEFFFKNKDILVNLLRMEPRVVKIGGQGHQAVKAPEGHYYIFTSNNSINALLANDIGGFGSILKSGEPVIYKPREFCNNSFNQNGKPQYFVKTLINESKFEIRKGLLGGFRENHKLYEPYDFGGFLIRIHLFDKYIRFDDFFYQEPNNFLIYKFSGDALQNKYLNSSWERSCNSLGIRNILNSPNTEKKLDSGFFSHIAKGVEHAARSEFVELIESKIVDEVGLVAELSAFGDLFSMNNREVCFGLCKGDLHTWGLLESSIFNKKLLENINDIR